MPDMKTIVFQGDSITDGERNRNRDHYMGSGYVTMTAGAIAVDYPGQYQFYNRGISGNRSVDMYARIKKDLLNLKPDILTVLIGVNDVWHEFSSDNGISAPKFENILDLFLTEVLEELPEIRIFMLEPFVLNGSATELHFDAFHQEVFLRADACKRVAQRLNIPYIPLQKKIEALASSTSNEYVLHDGVHPTCAGHQLISRELYAVMKEVL